MGYFDILRTLEMFLKNHKFALRDEKKTLDKKIVLEIYQRKFFISIIIFFDKRRFHLGIFSSADTL